MSTYIVHVQYMNITCTHTCTHTHICTHICTHTSTHVHTTYTYTYTHTHIFTACRDHLHSNTRGRGQKYLSSGAIGEDSFLADWLNDLHPICSDITEDRGGRKEGWEERGKKEGRGKRERGEEGGGGG